VFFLFVVFAMSISKERPQPYSKQLEKPLPVFSLPLLFKEDGVLTENYFQGQYYLLNVFASWCTTCRLEHATLINVAQENTIGIVGIAWKDRPENTKKWLENLGNPYEVVASDWDGKLVVPLGLTGTPETFLIDPNGTIIYHHQGMLTEDFINRKILSLIPKDYIIER
jgi:cytochrome c biogenesis protein CcmG/thiol:disulfide interchange protein DsbE